MIIEVENSKSKDLSLVLSLGVALSLGLRCDICLTGGLRSLPLLLLLSWHGYTMRMVHIVLNHMKGLTHNSGVLRNGMVDQFQESFMALSHYFVKRLSCRTWLRWWCRRHIPWTWYVALLASVHWWWWHVALLASVH